MYDGRRYGKSKLAKAVRGVFGDDSFANALPIAVTRRGNMISAAFSHFTDGVEEYDLLSSGITYTATMPNGMAAAVVVSISLGVGK